MNQPSSTATDPGVSAWVSANAGAGKTYLLTDRVTRLLLSGAKPSRILCLTYTKAAAAEMASRLFNRLGDWALLPDEKLIEHLSAIGAKSYAVEDLRKARRLFAQALEEPGGLKIQTIHSFCQHVLARFPVEAGIPSRFTVLDDRAAGELMRQARNTVLERAAGGDAFLTERIALLAIRASDGRFADILDFAIKDSTRLRALLARHDGDQMQLFAHLRKTLSVAEGEREVEFIAHFCSKLQSERATCVRIAGWLAKGSVTDKEKSEFLEEFLDADSAESQYQNLRNVFFTSKNTPRVKVVTNSTEKSDPELYLYLTKLQDRVIYAEEHRRLVATANLTEALVGVAFAVLFEFDRLKRERAALDYDDLIRATLALLDRSNASAWVLYKLDGGLDHVLVDEAQDTSPSQWKIVSKLTEEFFAGIGRSDDFPPRTIFAVGDEKQSIFSFQGADPAQFDRHREIFKNRVEDAELPFLDERPTVSRRSARAILEFVDAVFDDGGARDGLTSSGDMIHHDPHRAEIGRVELWPMIPAAKTPELHPWELPVDMPSRMSASTILASRIAARIAGWLQEGAFLPGTRTVIAPGDIMILVRRRNAFTEEMIRQLLDRGVSVAGADRMVLTEQIAIADLVALGRFVLLPEDDLNLAALLRSPLVDLTEQDLFDLANPRAGRSLWEELRHRKDESTKFTQAHEFLSARMSAVDFVPPFEFYAHALNGGLRKRLIARLGDEAADAIDEFLALALAHERAHPPSLEHFLKWFELGASEVKRDMEQSGGAVRVMTVHGAKGLEANIVILPDTAQIPDHDRKDPLLYWEDCVFYGMPKESITPIVEAAKDIAHAQELREYRRLLYVAATRAREYLVVCGYETKTRKNDVAWYRHLEKAARDKGRQETIDGEVVIAMGAELSGAGKREPLTAPGKPAIPAFLSQTVAIEPQLKIFRPSEAAGVDTYPLVSPLGDDGKRFRRGLLVHALLARLPDITPAKREAAALNYLKARGVGDVEAAALLIETMAIIGDDQFAPLFGPDSRAEIAITAILPELGNVRINGQIDRLAITDEAVLIADFKTNRPPPSSVEQTPLIYRTQMALYRAALQKIYPLKRIECALVWTDGARLMAIPEVLLDAEIARMAANLQSGDEPANAP